MVDTDDDDADSSILWNVRAFFFQTAQDHISEDCNSHINCRDNVRSYFIMIFVVGFVLDVKHFVFVWPKNTYEDYMVAAGYLCFVNRRFKRRSHTSAYGTGRNIYRCPNALCGGQCMDEWMCGWGCTYWTISTVRPWIMQTFTCIRSHTTAPL